MQGVVGLLIAVLLQIYGRISQYENRKSVKIWQRYQREYGVSLFTEHGVQGGLKTRDLKTQHQTAGLEYSGIDMYGKPNGVLSLHRTVLASMYAFA